jgi:hypothetical protein
MPVLRHFVGVGAHADASVVKCVAV